MLPEEPLLSAPTVAELTNAVNGTPISGDAQLREREVMGILVAGMTADHVLERLSDGMAVITPGDRSDVVLAVASAHAAQGFPSLSCIIINGGFELHPSISALVVGLRLRLPIIAHRAGHITKRPGRGLGPGPGHGRLAAQDRHRAGTDGSLRRCPGSVGAARHPDPDGDHSADVHLIGCNSRPGPIASTSSFRKATKTASSSPPGACCSACSPT